MGFAHIFWTPDVLEQLLVQHHAADIHCEIFQQAPLSSGQADRHLLFPNESSPEIDLDFTAHYYAVPPGVEPFGTRLATVCSQLVQSSKHVYGERRVSGSSTRGNAVHRVFNARLELQKMRQQKATETRSLILCETYFHSV